MIERVGIRRNPTFSAVALVLLGWLAAPAHAQSSEELRYEPVSTIALGGTLVVGTALSLTLLDPPSDCRWCEAVPTRHGPEYLRCLKAETDPGYAKYPQLPVRDCRGHEPSS